MKEKKRIIIETIKQLIFKWKLIERGNKNMKAVALTFDDGPYPEKTMHILEILRRENVKATFFLTGIAVEKYAKLAEQILLDGHEIGNHHYSHKRINKLTYKELSTEIRRGEMTIARKLSKTTKLIRPPYGKVNIKLLLFACVNKRKLVIWSLDSRDIFLQSLADVLDCIKARTIRSGEIILFHEGSKYITDIVPWIIGEVRSKGLKFCTISEILDN